MNDPWHHWYNWVENQMAGRNPAHDFSHVQRVLGYAKLLNEKEGGNWEVIKWAALFHDIIREDRHELAGDHASLGAKIAREKLNGTLPPETLDKVCHAISSHSRKSGVKPKSIEDKIIWDADKLDLVGLTGLMRWAIQGAYLGWDLEKSLNEYISRAERLGDNFLFTKTGRELGLERMKEAISLAKEELDLHSRLLKQ